VRFLSTQLDGAWLVDLDSHEDDRGYFARTWCQKEFSEHGLNPRLVQTSVSFNRRRGTLRGMHYQISPHEEAKLVRCARGSIYDVIVDLRSDSSSSLQWQAFELSENNQRALYVPEGFAHGFLTLQDNSEIHYQMSEFYHPESAGGFHWNDPSLAIDWKFPIEIISKNDDNLPLHVPLDTLSAA